MNFVAMTNIEWEYKGFELIYDDINNLWHQNKSERINPYFYAIQKCGTVWKVYPEKGERKEVIDRYYPSKPYTAKTMS